MRIFLTGANGFVGTWLQEHLQDKGDEVVCISADLDLSEQDRIAKEMDNATPDVVMHLAAWADVATSWKDPAKVFDVNAVGTLNVLQAARQLALPPKVVLISSADVYGIVQPAELPLTELSPLRPTTPYAASKVAAEFLGLQAYLGWKLPVVTARSFTHIGPGQRDDFVVSALARRVAAAERAGDDSIVVGNLEAERDFTDVRDVVRAYRLLAEKGKPGETYNVCSGTSVKVADVLSFMLSLTTHPIKVKHDPSLMRQVDVPRMLGSAAKLTADTGWNPNIQLEQSMRDVFGFWQKAQAGVQ